MFAQHLRRWPNIYYNNIVGQGARTINFTGHRVSKYPWCEHRVNY